MTTEKNNTENQENTPLIQRVDFCKVLPQRVEAAVCSMQQILKAAGIFLILLLLIYFYQFWQTMKLSRTVTALQQQEQMITKRMEPILSRYGTSGKASLLSQKTQHLQSDVKAKLQMISILGGENGQNIKGFSVLLIEIAKVIPDSVWLNMVEINRASDKIILNGYAYSRLDLLRFIEKLNADKIFKNFHFRLNELGWQNKERKVMLFEVKTQEAAK